jgi:hypothetical protein
MGPEASLPLSQQPANHMIFPPIVFTGDPFQYYLPIHAYMFASGLLPSDFPIKTLHSTLLSPIRATCPANLIILDLITGIMFGEEYRS